MLTLFFFLPLFPCHQEKKNAHLTKQCDWVHWLGRVEAVPVCTAWGRCSDERLFLSDGISFGSNCLVRGFRDVTVGVNTIMANAMFTCCLNCCGDGGSGHIPLKEMPTVQLDTHHMGRSASSLLFTNVFQWTSLPLSRWRVCGRTGLFW